MRYVDSVKALSGPVAFSVLQLEQKLSAKGKNVVFVLFPSPVTGLQITRS